MPAADPRPARSGRFRRFVGRRGGPLMFLVFAVVATGLLLVWRTWDVELLEYAWFQLLVFLVVAAPLVAMRFWGEGALPPDEATPGRRRPRGQREKPRRSGRRPGRRR